MIEYILWEPRETLLVDLFSWGNFVTAMKEQTHPPSHLVSRIMGLKSSGSVKTGYKI